MLVKTRGIVLRNVRYGDTSLIADIYTRELGLQSFILQGVRKARASLPAGLFQVMTLLDLVVYHKETASLKRVREAVPLRVYRHLPADMRHNAVGIFLVEVVRHALPHSEANPDLYDLLEEVFVTLDERSDDLSVYLLRVLLALAEPLGFSPASGYAEGSPYFDLLGGVFCAHPPTHPHYLLPETARFLDGLRGPLSDATVPAGLGSVQRRALLDGLMTYYRLHQEHFREPRSRAILQQVLSI